MSGHTWERVGRMVGAFGLAFGLAFGPWAIVGCGKTGECCHDGCTTDRTWPTGVHAADRLAVRGPLDQQAANGAVIHSTLFNYHFVADPRKKTKDGKYTFNDQPEPSAILTPWGKETLNRLARHANGSQLVVYVQTASDLETRSEVPADLRIARENLTNERMLAVRQYLNEVQPELAVVVGVSDPDAVGMTEREARTGYNMMLRGQPGVLSRSSILGAGIDPNVTAGSDFLPPVDTSDSGGASGGANSGDTSSGGSTGGM